MTIKTPHKHAELIKQWADGAAIQYLSTLTGKWSDLPNLAPAWHTDIQYRVKPEPIRTVPYRRYIAHVNGRYFTDVAPADDPYWPPERCEADRTFVKWIDTEWQTHAVGPAARAAREKQNG